MNNMQRTLKSSFSFFPEDRLNMNFSWQIWFVGWLAVFKAILWLTTDPVMPAGDLQVLFYKHSLFTLPFLICGIGIWNKRKWAIFSIAVLCTLELLFFMIYPDTLKSLELDKTTFISRILTFSTFVINGYLSGVFILCLVPVMVKHTREDMS